MLEAIINAIFDLSDNNIRQTFKIKQFDRETRYLHATIVNGEESFSVDNSIIVVANFKRSDGNAKAFKGEVLKDGTVKIPIPYWVSKYSGISEASISMIGPDNSRLTTFRFTLYSKRTQSAKKLYRNRAI